MKIIGLTGPSGAGKGMLSSLLLPYGVKQIDTDRVYHRILIHSAECKNELTAAFGEQILDEAGQVSRPKLAAAVFSETADCDKSERLALLNRITHRYVKEETLRLLSELEKEAPPAVLIDAPALFEAGMEKMCDIVVAVLAEKEVRVARILARDKISEENARARISSQHPDDFYSSRADFVFQNNGSREALEAALLPLLSALALEPNLERRDPP